MLMISIKNFYDNDIYFMKRIGNTIIINNNYEGILILDSELNTIKEEKLLDDLLISDCFVNQNTKEIMLYAYENNCFVYLDTVKNIKKIIPIQEEFEELGIESIICKSLCNADEYANGKRLYSTPGQLMMTFNTRVGRDASYQIKLG